MPSSTDIAETTVLGVEGLSKTYGRTRVLSDVSLSVQPREVHTLVGGNGSGKSTLIKLLAGVVPPDPCGHITAHARTVPAADWSPEAARHAHLRFVHQDLGLFANLSVVDNLRVGAGFGARLVGRIKWKDVEEESRRLMERYGVVVDPRRPLGELSLAEQSMVAIARALRDIDADTSACVVLDEPTAALPYQERDRLLGTLRSLAEAGHSVLFVTHHIDEVLEVSDRVTVLRDGRRIHTGPAADVDRQKLIELIVGDGASRRVASARYSTANENGGPDVARLVMSGVCSGVAESVSMTVMPGEIVGLAGLAGSGCDGVAPAIFGLQTLTAGQMWIDGLPFSPRRPSEAMRAGVAFLPRDRLRDGLFADLHVRANTALASTSKSGRWRIHHRREDRRVKQILDRFHVRPADPRRPINTLSGGNQQKVLLGRWGCREPRLFLLEDPTRGVDVGARSDIWSLLCEMARHDALSILVTSSDLDELAGWCDRVLVFRDGCLRRELVGADLTSAQITSVVHEAADAKAVGA